MANDMVEQGRSPYEAFAHIFSAFHDNQQQAGPSSKQLDSPIPYDRVLAENGGMLSALMGSLEEFLRAHPSGQGLSANEYDYYLLEHRTWSLIRAVFDNRLTRADPDFHAPSAETQIQENPYAPPRDLLQTIIDEDNSLSLYAALHEHLSSRALFSSPPPIEARAGYIPSTLRRAKAARLNNGTAKTTSLDPDFTLRDPHGQGLAGEDNTYQGPLLDTLWDLVRHGELDKAMTVCQQGGEPWRAASLMGGLRWTMGGMTTETMGVSPLDGNRARALWKKSCRAIAKNPTLTPAERQLYAALISDLPTLLPACDTWEDQLWAHIQHRLEARIDKRWHELGGFWEAEDQLLGRVDEENVEVGLGGLEEVFASISAVQTGEVARAVHNPYYAAQRQIILNRAETLLDTFADRVTSLDDSVSPELIGPLVRFFAHLVLVLRSLGQPVPESAANTILEEYLHVLERQGDDSLVAMYAACLREGNGEESYARFLRAMDPNATREQKQEALLRAKQYNLDVAAIAKETVRMILDSAFQDMPSLVPGQPDITTFASGLSERDVNLIRSIEWLTMVPETLDDALLRSNDVARYFLALGQANAAQALLQTLPKDLSTLSDDAGHQLQEHQHYAALFEVFAAHDAVDKQLDSQPKDTATQAVRLAYRKKLLAAIEHTHAATRELLTSGWLRFHISSRTAYGEQRKKELQRIRQIFVPDLVLRLHAVLVESRQTFPQLLQDALDLPKLVAAEEYHVYDEFLGRAGEPARRLVTYLERVREASMFALAGGSGSPFRAVKASAAGTA